MPATKKPAIPSIPSDRHAWVIYQLALRNLTFAKLAARRGLSRKTVQKVMNSPYPKMERLVARAIGLTPQQLWPERFDRAGRRLKTRGRPPKAAVRKKAGNEGNAAARRPTRGTARRARRG